MAVATVAVWAVFHFVKPLEAFATLIALAVVTVAVAVLHVDVETVGDIASIPNALPPFDRSELRGDARNCSSAGWRWRWSALAQAAGISAAVPNPDGSRPQHVR